MSAETTVWLCMGLGIAIVLIDLWSVRKLKKAVLRKSKAGLKKS